MQRTALLDISTHTILAFGVYCWYSCLSMTSSSAVFDADAADADADVNKTLASAIVYGVTATNTKDSLKVRWHVTPAAQPAIQGFMVRYQAHGSSVVQFSHHISPRSQRYEIMQLHENTYYDICIQVYTNLSWVVQPEHCIAATTSTDSLSVALGSTFGAFLALGVIVFFVFIAKWNHNRKLAKQLAQMSAGDDSYESVDNPEAAAAADDIEMSDVSLQVHEDAAAAETVDLSSVHSSQPHTGGDLANGGVLEGGTTEGGEPHHHHHHHHPRHHRHHHSTRERGSAPRNKRANLRRGASVDSGSPGDPTAISRGLMSPSNTDIPEEAELLHPIIPPPPPGPGSSGTTSPPNGDIENPFANPDGRPPDVRPKNSALLDMGNSFGNGGGLELGGPNHGGLRPNLSCPNWVGQS